MSPNISYSVVPVTFKLSFWKIKVRYTIYLALGRVFIKGGCLYEGKAGSLKAQYYPITSHVPNLAFFWQDVENSKLMHMVL